LLETSASAGKVPWELVADLVSGELPPEVRLGPAAGEDAALVEIGGELWAVASDPVSFTSADAGRLAVIVNANDVAVRGARPRFFLAVGLIAPHEATEERVRELLSQVRDTCAVVGATLIGGHTEITPGLPHSIPVTTGGLREGDLVGMTRSAGLEGTAILLAELGDRLRSLHDDAALEGADEILAGDWLLVAPEALRAAACRGVTALHDVTEGGVGEALYEMARASGLAVEVERSAITVLPATVVICDDLGLDPLGLIGSGSLIVGCNPEGAAEIETVFADSGVPFTWIGRATAADEGPTATVPRFPRDELIKTTLMRGIEAVIFDMDGTLVDSSYDWPAIRRRLGVTGASIIDDLNGHPEPERSRRWAELEERLLDRLGLDFDVVVTRDSGLWKPSGAPVTEAAKRLGVNSDRCLGVGDSHYDILAGREAGLGGVCVLHDGNGRHDGAADLAFKDIPAFVRYLKIVLE